MVLLTVLSFSCQWGRKILRIHKIRGAEAGRGLWKSCSPYLLLKEDHPDLVALDHLDHMAIEYLQGKSCTAFLGNLCQCLVIEKIFPDVQTEPPVFQCMVLAQSLGPTEKSLALPSLLQVHIAHIQLGVHQNSMSFSAYLPSR